MDYSSRLSLSYYKEIATLNEEHRVYLVQHMESGRIFVKKILSVYNRSVYDALLSRPVPGLPRLYCVYEEDGYLTVIEEYIQGITLQEIMNEEKPLPDDTVRLYAVKICEILEQLHSFDPPIIHRDIKPSNIMVTDTKDIILIDLNAARSGIEKEEDTVLLGTKGYAAPEQYGFGSSNVRTDIYAVGMVINTMCAGHFIKDIVQHSPFTDIIERCTRLDPMERFPDAEGLRRALIAMEYCACQAHPAVKDAEIPKAPPEKPDDKAKEKPAQEKRSRHDYLPPGFRTGKVSHMLAAVPAYILIIYSSLTAESENDGVTALLPWTRRVAMLLVLLSVVAVCTDYLGIQRLLPLCRNKRRFVRLIGYYILVNLLWIIIAVIIAILELLISALFGIS